jgi:hypothetical protein
MARMGRAKGKKVFTGGNGGNGGKNRANLADEPVRSIKFVAWKRGVCRDAGENGVRFRPVNVFGGNEMHSRTWSVITPCRSYDKLKKCKK